MDYISTAQAAEKLEVSERCVQKYCVDERIQELFRFSRLCLIPKGAFKPKDPRKNRTVENP